MDVFLKFPCIQTDASLPAAKRVDPHGRCARGVNNEDFVRPCASCPSFDACPLLKPGVHLEFVQRLSCHRSGVSEKRCGNE